MIIGYNCKNQSSHHCSYIYRAVYPLFQILNCHRHCLIFSLIQYKWWKQVVVPNPHCLKNCNRYTSRLCNRKYNSWRMSGMVCIHQSLQPLQSPMEWIYLNPVNIKMESPCTNPRVDHNQSPRIPIWKHICDLDNVNISIWNGTIITANRQSM